MESDSTTSSPVALKTIRTLAADGYYHSFVIDGDRLRCTKTGEFFRPEELTIVDAHRDEGISDPDDMSVIYVIQTQDGMKGTIQDAFGMYASPALGFMIEKMKDFRSEEMHQSVATGITNP